MIFDKSRSAGTALAVPLGETLKSIAKTGSGPVTRRLTAGAARILMYHRFGPSVRSRRLGAPLFERQLQFLVRHFRVRRLIDVVDALHAGRPLERLTAVLTIDDGYADFIEYAYPLLQRYQVPATVFVATDFVERNSWLWFDANHYILHHTKAAHCALRIAGATHHLDLSSVAARNRAWSEIGDACLRMTAEERAEVLERLRCELAVPLPDNPVAEYRPMQWADARRLDPTLVQFGAHTCTHPVLSRCTAAEIEYEVCESKRVVEKRLQTTVPAFCYPNGEPGDYDERTVGAVEAAGYACATVAHGGPISSGADLFRLERIGAVGDMESFCSAMNGVTTLADKWRTWRHEATS